MLIRPLVRTDDTDNVHCRHPSTSQCHRRPCLDVIIVATMTFRQRPSSTTTYVVDDAVNDDVHDTDRVQMNGSNNHVLGSSVQCPGH